MTSTRPADAAPDQGPLWDAKRVCRFLSVTDRWIRRAMSGGWFPRPDFRLNGQRGMRWRQSTIDAYLKSKENCKGVPKL